MAEGFPWFKFFPQDFLGATAALSAQQVGAYTLLLCEYYRRGGPVPDDRQSIYILCRCQSSSDRAGVDRVLRDHFELRDGYWRNGRADKEILTRTSRKKAGKAGADGRWGVIEGGKNANK